MRELTLPDTLFARLQKFAVPLVDTPADVIERLLTHYEKTKPEKSRPDGGIETSTGAKESLFLREARITERAPRERGVTIEIDGHVIRAISVKELYKEVLKYLLDSGHSKRLRELVPFSTSSLRYLIADKPIHPNEKEFVVPVKHGGYYMEAHKDYKNGIKHLSQFVTKVGLKLKYLG
jgi:hypothetical protein